MLSWKRTEVVIGVLALLLVVLVFLRTSPVEGAKGFYVIRPTHWLGTPTGITIELTSFFPTTLPCVITADGVEKRVTIDPRSSVSIEINGHYLPGQYVVVPIEINCGEVRERGEVRLFIS